MANVTTAWKMACQGENVGREEVKERRKGEEEQRERRGNEDRRQSSCVRVQAAVRAEDAQLKLLSVLTVLCLLQ